MGARCDTVSGVVITIMRESHDNKYNMVHHQARRISHRAFFLNADKRFIDAMKRSTMFDHVYSYHLDRLASDDGVTYTYGAAGNRTTRTENGATATYTLGVGDQLASWTGGAYTHDVAGNVTRIERDGRPTLDLTWNSQYQIVSVATNGVFAEGYEYDALGRRVSTATLEGTVRHVYDDSWQVVADLDEQDNVIASYTWGDGIDNLLAVKVGGATYYPLTDIQGTVWGYIDSQNNVVARWQYDAWGNVVDEDVSAPALAKLRYRFQCREWSAATGLVNFRMRWYDPATGMWLGKDSIGLEGGHNLYLFCFGLPICFVDPYGTVAPMIIPFAIEAAKFAYFSFVAYSAWQIFVLNRNGGCGGSGGFRGERGRTSSSGETGNPYKHTRPHPEDTDKIIYKDPQTGKSVIKKKPADYPK